MCIHFNDNFTFLMINCRRNIFCSIYKSIFSRLIIDFVPVLSSTEMVKIPEVASD